MNFIDNAKLQFRSAFNTIFNKKPSQEIQLIQREDLVGFSNPISSYKGPAIGNALIRRIIDCIASYGARIKIQHVVNQNGKIDILEDNIHVLCNLAPNELMTAHDFWYRVIAQLYITNNAFIYPKYDNRGQLIALYPLDYHSCEWKEDKKGNVYVDFQFSKQRLKLPYEMLIHLRRQFMDKPLSGEDQTVQMVDLINQAEILTQARENIIRANGTAQFILQSNVGAKQEDIDKAVEKFVNSYGYKNKIAAIDNKFTITPVKSQLTAVTQEEIDAAKEEICSYFGVSQAILNGDFTREQFEAFSRTIIEPLCLQIEQVLTIRLLSKQKINSGHSIRCIDGTLQQMSIADKTNLIEKVLTNGAISVNEARQILGLDIRPEEEANTLRVSLNQVNLQSATKYQLSRAGIKVEEQEKIDSLHNIKPSNDNEGGSI